MPEHPSQWFSSWSFAGGCPPVPALAAVRARPGAGQVTLSWPDAGLGVRYLVYLQGPGDAPVTTVRGDGATITGLPSGGYLARVVPVNARQVTGRGAQTTFVVP